MEQPADNLSASGRRIIVAACLAVVAVLSGAAIVSGDAGSDRTGTLDDGRHLVRDAAVSPDDAVRIALGDRNGRVEDVDLEQNGLELVYEIEINNEDVYIDALTGQVLYAEFDNDDDFSSRPKVQSDHAPRENAPSTSATS